jgi:hypothetical protein
MRRFPALLAVVATLAIGCGDDPPEAPAYPENGTDQEQIAAVIELFNAAASDLDAELLCEQVIPPSARPGSPVACAEPLAPAMEAAPENWGELTDPAPAEIHGDSASVDATQDGAPIALDFIRERGRWWMVVFD